MTWPTDMDTTRMQATINQQAERIFQLEDQITRLQIAVRHHAEHRAVTRFQQSTMTFGEYKEYEDALRNGAGLRPGDLDPIE